MLWLIDHVNFPASSRFRKRHADPVIPENLEEVALFASALGPIAPDRLYVIPS